MKLGRTLVMIVLLSVLHCAASRVWPIKLIQEFFLSLYAIFIHCHGLYLNFLVNITDPWKINPLVSAIKYSPPCVIYHGNFREDVRDYMKCLSLFFFFFCLAIKNVHRLFSLLKIFLTSS